MTNGARVPGVGTFAEEFIRILTANTVVLARIWITTIRHLTSIEDNLVLAAVLLLLPLGRQFIVTVDSYHSHAADESIVAFLSNHTTDHII